MYAKGEKIIPVALEDEMQTSYIDYSMSVIVGRALPDVRDGLKPVHRRILYAMKGLGLSHNRPYRKCARIVGDCLGKYHPHGDMAVYDALVRMVQDFSLRYPLIDGQGNFGSIDGDRAAAMRYTEARLASTGEILLTDLEKNTVDFRPNFDETLKEPVVLPSILPNLVINGSSGIAVGMATNIPPHNLGETIEALKVIIDNPDISVKELMKFIPGPDFPTGGIIYGLDGIKKAYKTGRGRLKVRARAGIEPGRSGKENIIITEIPYTISKSSLIQQIVKLVKNGKAPDITDVRDESDREGIRIVIENKRNTNPKVTLNRLYKHTSMEDTFGVILLALDHGRPLVMSLKRMLLCYLEHRRDVVYRRTRYDLEKAEARAHILEGFKIALKNIDEVVSIIRKSKSRDAAKKKLISKLKITDIQADAILDMRLYQLTGMEQDKINEEYLDLIKKITYYKDLLSSEKKIMGIIKKELTELSEKYKSPRRTEIVGKAEEVSTEDLIAKEGCLITISRKGYIKRVPVTTYKAQRRGGKGVYGMEVKDEDFVEHLFMASTHDYILFFTEKGRVHWLKVYEVPQGGRMAKGKAIVNMLDIKSSERIAAMVRVEDFSKTNNIIMGTRKGYIKKTKLDAFSNPRSGGIVGIKIGKDDELIGVELTSGKDDVILMTRKGKSIRFPEAECRPMGRATRGVRGIKLGAKDEVVCLTIVEERAHLLVVTEEGYGKRTNFSEYRCQGRGGKGIIGVKVTKKNGQVVRAFKIKEEDEIVLISTKAKMIRISVKNISVIGRATQGVRVLKLRANEKLEDATVIMPEEDDNSC